MSTEIEQRCAHKLRELRRSKGLTLQECELISNGALKAVVLGSYERGHRAISLARLQQLADFYDVPIDHFLSDRAPVSNEETGRLIFDLRRIRNQIELAPPLEMVKRYLTATASMRGDWNGEVISLRGSDAEVLSLINNFSVSELFHQLHLAGFIFASELNGRQNP
jgi:transcriptional regulator with XRE-family HTH domain